MQHMSADGTLDTLFPATNVSQVQGLEGALTGLETSVDSKIAGLETAVDSKILTLEDYVDTAVSGIGGQKYATYVIGTALSGYRAGDVNYLCTGTDDHVIINQAIQDLPPAHGGKILLLEGRYMLGGGIKMNRDNITLEGMGNGTWLVNSSSDTNPSDTWYDTIALSANNCKVQNMRVGGAGSLEDFAAIAVYNGLNNVIHNNYISDCYRAIKIMSETSGIISNNYFADGGPESVLFYSSQWIVSSNVKMGGYVLADLDIAVYWDNLNVN